ncbi:MAG: DUF1320 domain-containing protein [Desulfarculus sp.]|nr:DUF1320 domain-containing protein [Desulfarculus sp.]
MAYSTLDDLRERLPEEQLVNLTDDAGAGAVDGAVVLRAIADADAEIEGYLGGRHALPLSPVPALVRKLSVEMAIYHLHSRRGGAPEEWRKRYEDARRLLENIARGLVSLGQADPAQPANNAAEAASFPRLFSRRTLRDF